MSIARLFIPVALLCGVAACTQDIPEMQAVAVVPANALTLTGAVTYNERTALSADSRLRLTVHDMSNSDRDASIVAKDIVPLEGKTIPIAFSVNPKTAKFMQLKKYALRAAIIDPNDAPLWTSETAYIINPFAGAQNVGTLKMIQVEPRPSERSTPVKPGTFSYICGPDEDILEVDVDAGKARVGFKGKTYDLARVASAFGGKYETGARADRVVFSTQNETAAIGFGMSTPLACALIEPKQNTVSGPRLAGETWNVVKLREEPFVQGTKLTLSFADGKLSGSTGCNSYFADYEVSNGTLNVGQLGMTEKLCPPEVMAQEALFSKFLASAESFKIDDDGALIIKSRIGHKLTARR